MNFYTLLVSLFKDSPIPDPLIGGREDLTCWQAVWRIIFKIRFLCVRFERRKVYFKKQTYTKTEAYKLYCGVFWIFLPNIIKIDPYNFELHCFKVDAFFETQCSTKILQKASINMTRTDCYIAV